MRIVFSLYFNSFAYFGKKKDENCTSIRTENSLALLIPNHFVLADCPRDYKNILGAYSFLYLAPLDIELIAGWYISVR